MTDAGNLLDTLFSAPLAAERGVTGLESVNLFFALAGAVVLAHLARSRALPRLPRMYAGYGLLIVASAATVAEGFLWAPLFNLAEHLATALASVAFALSIYELGHPRYRPGKEDERGKGA
jgi:hypothetical protein